MIHVRLALLSLILIGCRSSLVPVTQRNLDLRPHGATSVRTRSVEEPEKPPEIYVLQKRIGVEKVKSGPVSGSLYRLDDPRNILMGEIPRGYIDDYLDIRVTSHQLTEESNKDQAGESDKSKAEAAGKDKPKDKDKGKETKTPAQIQAEEAKKLEETLLKALPDLDAGPRNPEILKNLRMRVANLLPNGDAMVVMTRQSTNGFESNAINVRARVPHEALRQKRQLTTNDLYDVEWAQSEDGDVTKRKSLAWEDEYTLRMSGFSEAKSKAALTLEEKKNQMRGVKKQLETNLKSLTAQRVQMAQERQKLANERAEIVKERESLKGVIKEREDQIEEGKQEITELKKDMKGLEEEYANYQKQVEEEAAADKEEQKAAKSKKNEE